MKKTAAILAILLLVSGCRKKNEIEVTGVMDRIISDPVSIVYMHIEEGETVSVQTSDQEVIDDCVQKLNQINLGELCEVEQAKYSDIFILVSQAGEDEAFEFENGKYIHNGRRYDTAGLEKVIEAIQAGADE